MNDFELFIAKHWTDNFPEGWSFLWSPEEASQIPQTHKDQIHFIDKEGTKFVKQYVYSTGMAEHLFVQQPFINFFGSIDEFQVTENCDQQIKKWLFQKGIPFSRWVFADQNISGQAVMMTWKMVIKYWDGLFWGEDVLIFDSTLEWGLYYFHEGTLFFGSDVIFDKVTEERKVLEYNRLIKEWQNNIK